MMEKSNDTYTPKKYIEDIGSNLKDKELLPKNAKEAAALGALGVALAVGALAAIENADHVPVPPAETTVSQTETSNELEEYPVPVENPDELTPPVEITVNHHVTQPGE